MGGGQKFRLGRWDRRRLCKSVLLEQPEPHAPPLAPDRFRPDLGVVLPGVRQRRAVGETFLAGGRFVITDVEEPRVRRHSAVVGYGKWLALPSQGFSVLLDVETGEVVPGSYNSRSNIYLPENTTPITTMGRYDGNAAVILSA